MVLMDLDALKFYFILTEHILTSQGHPHLYLVSRAVLFIFEYSLTLCPKKNIFFFKGYESLPQIQIL